MNSKKKDLTNLPKRKFYQRSSFSFNKAVALSKLIKPNGVNFSYNLYTIGHNDLFVLAAVANILLSVYNSHGST